MKHSFNFSKFPLILFLLFLNLPSSFACIHFAKNTPYEIKEGTQHVMMFHDGKMAHMIVSTDITSASANLPETISWVLPFPIKPASYSEVDGKIFSELGNLLVDNSEYLTIGGGSGAKKGIIPTNGGNIKVHETNYVGNYSIKPIEILNDNAKDDFNNWLKKNNFNSMPNDKQKPYLKKGTVFLAVQVKTEGKKSVNIKPLHIVYSSDTLSYPIRFTHDTRTLNLDLFIFAPYNIYTSHREKKTTIPEAFFGDPIVHFYSAESVKEKDYPEISKTLKDLNGYLYKFSAVGLNTKGKYLKDLNQDPEINPLLK